MPHWCTVVVCLIDTCFSSLCATHSTCLIHLTRKDIANWITNSLLNRLVCVLPADSTVVCVSAYTVSVFSILCLLAIYVLPSSLERKWSVSTTITWYFLPSSSCSEYVLVCLEERVWSAKDLQEKTFEEQGYLNHRSSKVSVFLAKNPTSFRRLYVLCARIVLQQASQESDAIC